MLRHRTLRRAVSLIVCIAFLTVYVFPSSIQEGNGRLRVAFLGIRYTNLSPGEEEKITNDLLNLLQIEASLSVVTQAEAERVVGREVVESLITARSKAELAKVSSQLGVEHLFFGRIANQSKEASRTLLAGEYYRYDSVTDALFSVEILKYYDSFHEELMKIRREFVLTILPRQESILASWPILLLFGITVVGLLALILSPGKTSLEGTNNPPPSEN
jgi:hypothetical protein